MELNIYQRNAHDHPPQKSSDISTERQDKSGAATTNLILLFIMLKESARSAVEMYACLR